MSSLLPVAAEPELASSIALGSVRLGPSGLGGYVGMHDDPVAELRGRRVRARVDVTVRAADAAALGPAVSLATRSVLARERGGLAQLGILRVALDALGAARPLDADSPEGAHARDVSFDVLFEYVPVPVAAGGVIETIPLDVDVTLSAVPRLLRRGAFLSADALTSFEVVDDPAAVQDSPSDWGHDAASQAIRQQSLIRGGPAAATARKPGTYLLLRTSAALPPVSDFSLSASFRATSPGGVGLVFRYHDPENFCFALLDSVQPFRMIARKTDGSFGALAGGLDDTRGFDVDRLYTLRLAVTGASMRLLVDGATVLEATDPDEDTAGRVGLMTRGCDGALFHDLTLLQL